MCVLNWSDAPKTISFALSGRSGVREMWSGEDLGQKSGKCR